jgi:hypothetical protein
MTKRFWSVLVSAPVFAGLVLAPVAVDARPGGTTSTAAAKSSTTTRSTPGTARPIGPTSITGPDAIVTRATTIHGSAWTADNTPIAQARLRLRNVVNGRIEGSTIANDAGQFVFQNVAGGSYIVELVSGSGKTEVVGHVFSIAPGETVATFVRTGTKVPWFNGFFGNSMTAVSSTAASEGITAIAPVARPVSSNR